MRANGNFSDEQFASRLAADDQSVLAEIVRACRPRVERSLASRFRRVLSNADIDDVLLAALARVWQRRHDFNAAKGSLAGWFEAMAHDSASTLAKSRWVKNRRLECDLPACDLRTIVENRSIENEDDAADNDERSYDDSHLPNAVEVALAQLSPLQRQILLADANSSTGTMPTTLLAAELHVKPATIWTNRKRGRLRLRKLLAKQGFTAPLPRTSRERERERESLRRLMFCTVKGAC